MASKRRIRRRSCTNKKRYSTRLGAELTAAKFNPHFEKNDGRRKDVYYCNFCGGYHIGTSPINKTHEKRRKLFQILPTLPR
jgi:hypothetical protein